MKFLMLIFFMSVMGFASELTAMQDACKRSQSEACYELGAIYSGEDGLKPQLKKSEYYLKKACELDHDKACKLLESVQKKLSSK